MTSAYFFTIYFAFFIIIAIAVISHYLPQRFVRVCMVILYFAMLAGEVIKQYIAFTAEGGYNLRYAPLHFSSTFYITIGFSLFGGKRLRHVGQTVLFVSGLMLIFLTLYTPKSIFGVEPDYLFTAGYESRFGYFFHMSVLIELAVMLARGEYKPKLYDTAIFAAFVLVYAAIAAPVAVHTGINFAGMSVSYISILETFRQSHGQLLYLVVYYLFICAVGIVTIYAYYLLRRLYIKLSKKNGKI